MHDSYLALLCRIRYNFLRAIVAQSVLNSRMVDIMMLATEHTRNSNSKLVLLYPVPVSPTLHTIEHYHYYYTLSVRRM